MVPCRSLLRCYLKSRRLTTCKQSKQFGVTQFTSSQLPLSPRSTWCNSIKACKTHSRDSIDTNKALLRVFCSEHTSRDMEGVRKRQSGGEVLRAITPEPFKKQQWLLFWFLAFLLESSFQLHISQPRMYGEIFTPQAQQQNSSFIIFQRDQRDFLTFHSLKKSNFSTSRKIASASLPWRRSTGSAVFFSLHGAEETIKGTCQATRRWLK